MYIPMTFGHFSVKHLPRVSVDSLAGQPRIRNTENENEWCQAEDPGFRAPLL